ncbi:glucosidase II beta subunit-like-domain-containing protein [Radiomyces spectabilis]|uniref:glucosidase II beta subunit-like-domain-containing protein n=1 Tax=Radiomyces spectabilis TaxID=64574 RepID=UPI002220FA66|nr:glucosidase II beta subunit-like-domain-containing protein [Radiomyces spectabilis]KAI8368154.1 glucosidase II beta subunit-like-domain-containing protein [Radiomyces spectabilis]
MVALSQLSLTVPCILSATWLAQAATPAVKGVDPAKYELYASLAGHQWECLDGSKKIPYSSVNDDYCDCADGSDEPGTSACSHGHYYCENKGHIPAYIKSSQVNDGVCDDACCDGSDEYNGFVQCPDRCKEVAAEYKKTQDMLNKIRTAGVSAKQKLIDEAQAEVAAWQNEKSKLEDTLVIKRAELLRRESELEQLSQQRKSHKTSQKRCPSNKANPLTDALERHVRSLQEEIDVLVSILRDMKRDHNHNFHDMAVKAAIAGYDEFLPGYEDLKKEIDTDLKEYEEQQDNADDDFEETDEEEAEEEEIPQTSEEKALKEGKLQSLLNKAVSALPLMWKSQLDQLLSRVGMKQNEEKDAPALETAEKVRDTMKREIDDAERRLNEINDELAKDYGPQREWLKLKDTCVEKNEGEYTYSVCIHGAAHQKSNKDSMRTHLGTFEAFVGPKGTDDYYREQSFTHGTRCWNGPERSVRAFIDCGAETEIIEVTEPEKCEYHFRMRSPAVCSMEPIQEPHKPQARKPAQRYMHEEL